MISRYNDSARHLVSAWLKDSEITYPTVRREQDILQSVAVALLSAFNDTMASIDELLNNEDLDLSSEENLPFNPKSWITMEPLFAMVCPCYIVIIRYCSDICLYLLCCLSFLFIGTILTPIGCHCLYQPFHNPTAVLYVYEGEIYKCIPTI